MSLYTYPVTLQHIAGLPQNPYENGVGKYEGICMHDTACDGDSAPAEASYESRTWQTAFVHEFIDHQTVIQVADPSYLAWGAGPHANQRYIHLELCHDGTRAGFLAAFDRWCERSAMYLFAAGLVPKDGVTLLSHAEVSKLWPEDTDHTDPIAYLARFGVTWNDVVTRVTNYYNILEKDAMAGTFDQIPGIPKACQLNPLLQPNVKPAKFNVVVGYFDGTTNGCPAAEDAAQKIRETFGWHCTVEQAP